MSPCMTHRERKVACMHIRYSPTFKHECQVATSTVPSEHFTRCVRIQFKVMGTHVNSFSLRCIWSHLNMGLVRSQLPGKLHWPTWNEQNLSHLLNTSMCKMHVWAVRADCSRCFSCLHTNTDFCNHTYTNAYLLVEKDRGSRHSGNNSMLLLLLF